MKKMMLVCGLILMSLLIVSSAAFSAPVSVTLLSSQTASAQFAALAEYISKLPPDNQEEWFRELELLLAGRNTVYALAATNMEEDIVYVTNSGERYHKDKNCWGLRSAKTISAVIKEVAVEMGRTPCKLCYKNGDR